jgi:hypothetical protein
MYLIRLIYTSRISSSFQSDDLKHILESAQRHNKLNYITGLLGFNRKIFLQCLEGSREAVNKTYQRILKDERHTDALILDYSEITHRDFSEWSMGFIPDSKVTAPINLKFSGNDIFDPYEMSGVSAHELLLELSKALSGQDN